MSNLQQRAKLVQELQGIQKSLALGGFHKDAFVLGIKLNTHKRAVAAEYVDVPADVLNCPSKAVPALVEEIAVVAAALPVDNQLKGSLKEAMAAYVVGHGNKQLVAKLRTAMSHLPDTQRVASTLSDKE